MNHTYKTLYNTALGTWVAVPEIARNRGKSPRNYRHASSAFSFTFARTALASALLLAGGQALAAIPEGTAVRSTDIAIGTGASADSKISGGYGSTAVGTNAKATSRDDVAIGYGAGAKSGSGANAGKNGERVMIGANANVGSDRVVSINAHGSVGTVNLQVKNVGQAVAIGGGTGVQPEHHTYAYGDQSLAIGSDTLAYGDSSVAIGGDDLDQAGNQQTSYTDPNSGAQTTGTVRQAYQALTGDTMNSGVYAKTVSKQAAVAVGVQAQAADLGVALGAKSGATKTNSVAIGTGAQATLDNAVAIGGGSKTLEAGTKQESTIINGVTYNWAGGGKTLPGDIVSFGATGYERQLKHVAAGEVSANSTDAINGSQLYAITNQLQAGQTHYYSVNDGGSRGSNYNNDGATGSNSLAAGVGAVASAKNTVAAGYNAQATHDGAVAVGANTSATNASTALGDSSKATGENSTALGWNANAAGRADVFIGKRAGDNTSHANNNSNIGIGEGAVSNVGSTTPVDNVIGIGTGAAKGIQAKHNIALGAYANGTDNGSPAVTTTNNVAIGERTRASGGNSIAIGNRNKAEGQAAIALGVGSNAAGQNSFAAGQNTVASASGTVAIGGSANPGNGATASSVQAVAIGQLSKASGNKTTAVGAEANASGLNSTALGTGASTAGGLGGLNAVAVGAKATANAGSTTAVGAAAQASGINAAAFGAGAQAGTKGTAVGYNAVVTHNGAVALGADSVSSATFGPVPNATINGITYGNFAAANVNATVSVGSAGNERAITNVGAGRINANSTDAINGSQLYAIANQLQAGQTHYYSVNDGGTRGSNYNNDGATAANTLAAGVNARAGSSNSVAMGDGADTGNGVNSNIKGLNTAIGSNAKIGANGKISWEATAIGADTVAEGVRTTAVGYGASATEYYATAIGYKSTAPEWHALAIGSQATVAPTASTDVAAAQAITTNLTNVSDASKSAAAVAIGRQATAGGYGAIAQGLNTQATTAYATAVGANAKAGKIGSTAFGAYASAEADSSVALGRYSHADREKLAGTATLGADPLGVGAQAGTLTWQSNAGAVSVGSSSNRNYAGVDVPKTTRQIINLAAGSADTDAVNVAQLKAAGFNLAVSQSGGTATDETPATATGADDKKIANGETFTLDAGSGISLKQKGGKITIATDAQTITDNAQLPVVYTKADGSKVYKRGNKFYDAPVGGNEVAAADVIASMQNAAGSTTAPTVLANVASNLADASSVTSNPANNARGDFANKGNNAATVKDVLNAGFNVQGNGAAKDFVTHGDTINFANGRGTTANVSTSNGTTTVKFDTPLEYVGAGGAASTTPTNTVKLVGGNASDPVKLQNVADGNIAANSKDAINGGQLHDALNNINTNIAASRTKVEAGDGSVSVTPTTPPASGPITYKVSVNTDGTTITKDANGKLKANTTTLNVPNTGNDAGKVTAPAATDAGKLVTAGDIANAINGSGFTLTTSASTGGSVSGTTTELVNPGETVTVDAGKNISITQAANKITVATKDQVEFSQATVKDAAGNKTVTNANGVTITPQSGNPVSLTNTGLNNGGNKITNVAAGDVNATSSDAVNGSQLHAVATQAAKRNTVKAGNNVTVDDSHTNASGGVEYVVHAEKSTVSGAGDVIVTATNMGNNVTNYQVSLSGGVKQDIGKGVQALNIVQTQGIRFGGDTGTTNVKKLGDTMMIMGDQNVKTAADVDGIHMRLNPDVNVDSVTTGDTKMSDEGVVIKNGPALTKQGVDAGNLPVRNVAPGRIAHDSRDAVNGAQLHALGRYVDNVDKRAKAGTASAIATAGLPQAYRPGASMVAAAGGYYDGQSAVAIGVSTISDNGKWIIKGAANVNSKEAGAVVGIGYQW